MIIQLHDPAQVAQHSKWDYFLVLFKHETGELYVWERNGYAAVNPDMNLQLRAITRAELVNQYGSAYGHARDNKYSGEIYVGAFGAPIND